MDMRRMETNYNGRPPGDPPPPPGWSGRPAFFGSDAWAPLASAWKDHHEGERDGVVFVHADEGDPDPMPVSLFFRSREEMTSVDREALARARGRILDGGAGVGAMALILQEEGLPVTAVEVIPEGVAIMRDRGVVDARAARLEDLPPGEVFDTILLLMNGTALAGTLGGFPDLLRTLERLLAPGGQVLVDSTDMVQDKEKHGSVGPAHGWEGEYPGELQYQMEYRGKRGTPFPQLFLDAGTLSAMARRAGWCMEVVWEGEDGEYLARLVRSMAPEG